MRMKPNNLVVEKYGMKIGYLGFSDVGPNFTKASGDKAGLLFANNPQFDEIVKMLQNKLII